MLIDEEQEPLGELEIEEKKSELPDKYRKLTFLRTLKKQFMVRLINIQMFSQPDKRVKISKRCRFSRGSTQSILTTLKWSTILGFRSG